MDKLKKLTKFNPDHNYVEESEDFKRKNLTEYLKTVPRKELCGFLFDESEKSDVELDNWDIQSIAGLIVDLKFGKEKE
jgi:hypothetical protein